MIGRYGQPWIPPEGSAANVRSLPCACGERITCITDTEGILLGVRAHQRMSVHRAWSDAQTEAGVFPPRTEAVPCRSPSESF